MMPDAPNVKPFQKWGYKPKGPYWFIKSPHTVVNELTLDEAIAMFAEQAVPAHSTTMAYVGDRTGVIVVGYYTHPYSAPAWFGLEIGFRLLYEQPLVETLEILLAEMNAREAAG
jgi:hypothetical protein